MNEINQDKPEKQVGEPKVQRFLELYTLNNRRIYSFIMSLVSNWGEADDISQETMAVLWGKFDEFTPGTDFLSWAFQVAYFQVLRHFRNKQVTRKHFNSTVLENLKEIACASAKEADDNLEALRKCIKKIPPDDQHLISLRYEDGATIKTVSLRLGRSVHMLYKEYKRIHSVLFHCIRRQLNLDIQ